MTKRVLVIAPFEGLYPPMNGGMLRAMNLLHQLSKHFEVTVIINQEKSTFLNCVVEFPAIKNSEVISTKANKKIFDLFLLFPRRFRDALRYRYWNRSFMGSAEKNYLLVYPMLRGLLKKNKFDFIVIEEMGILNLGKLIHRHQPDAHVIYDAYNVNTRLAEAALKNNQLSNTTYQTIKRSESTLYKYVDSVFTCSEQDLEQLREMNGGRLNGVVIPNGVSIETGKNGQDISTHEKNSYILFCGSLDYLPNQEGLLWFCKQVFPLIIKEKSAVRLMVVGKGKPNNDLADLLNQETIIYYGAVDKVSVYYKKAAVAIVPLLSGSGTRLKLLEAMGNKVAVVSTSVGAEGIEYSDKRNILIADDGDTFAQDIIQLLDNKEVKESLAAAGFELVSKLYDWNIIGGRLRDCIENRGTVA